MEDSKGRSPKERFSKSSRDVLMMAKDALQRQGERMIELAARINPDAKGRPLDSDEKELIRVAFLPEIKTTASRAIANYSANDKKHFECDLEHMATVFTDIEKL